MKSVSRGKELCWGCYNDILRRDDAESGDEYLEAHTSTFPLDTSADDPGYDGTSMSTHDMNDLRMDDWRSFVAEVRGESDDPLQLPEQIKKIILAAPNKLGAFANRISEGVRPVLGRSSRQRDLLPLPFCHMSAEDKPVFAAQLRRQWDPSKGKARSSWLWLIILALNFGHCISANSTSTAHFFGPATPAQARSLGLLEKYAEGYIDENPDRLSKPCWRTELKRKRVDYSGDEVALAEKLTLKQIQPGLPPRGVAASIEAASLAEGETLRCLLDPSLVLKSEGELPARIPSSRIWATDHDYYEIVSFLWNIGMLVIIDEHDIPVRRNRMILNGLFGVVKPKDLPIKIGELLLPILRLIFNLIPSNTCQHMMPGDVAHLPSWMQWQLVRLLESEIMLWTSADKRFFFYVFKNPPVWHRWFVLSKQVPGACIGKPAGLYWVATCSIGMGWIQAVTLIEHLYRNLVRRVEGPINPRLGAFCAPPSSLQDKAELVRSRAVPVGPCAEDDNFWEIYIDDFDEAEIFQAEDLEKFEGSSSPELLTVIAAGEAWNAPGHADKDDRRSRDCKRLGIRVLGPLGYLVAPQGYCNENIDLSFDTLSMPLASRKLMQVLLGRWCRLQQLRKATAFTFDESWKFVGKRWRKRGINSRVAEEVLLAMCLAPLYRCDLKLRISPEVTISDASMTGGAVLRSQGLTRMGLQTLLSSAKVKLPPFVEQFILASAFDGIGGAMRAVELNELPVAAYLSSETHKPSSRVVKAAWPQVIELGDISKITLSKLREVARRFPRLTKGLKIGGFPCVELSALKAGALGLGGESGLFYEQIRFFKLLDEAFPCVDWEECYENVSSMKQYWEQRISDHLNLTPTFLCGSNISHNRRPRLLWHTWELQGGWHEISPIRNGRCTPPLTAERGPIERWIEPGSSWPGAEEVDALPTFTKHIPRKRPPRDPAGLSNTDAEGRAAWAADQFAVPPYQHNKRYKMLRPSGKLELPGPRERERLLGFLEDHTLPAVASGFAKRQPGATYSIRQSQLGNTFNTEYMAWLLSHMFVAWGWRDKVIKIEDLSTRAGPPFSVGLEESVSRAEVQRQFEALGPMRGFCPEQSLVLSFIRGAEHRGSDVRLSAGTICNPDCWPRHSIDPRLWRWGTVLAFPFHHPGHISELELRVGLAMLQWRLRAARNVGSCYFHLYDSAVCIAVSTKHRSSSHQLNLILKRMSCLELAGCVHGFFGYVRSELNPADKPSRRKWTKWRPSNDLPP